jgi:hypothetical protein
MKGAGGNNLGRCRQRHHSGRRRRRLPVRRFDANIVDGGNGNDHIHAGAGNYNDVVTGGAGADTFHWLVDEVNGHDIVTDFDPLQDALDLLDPYGDGSPNVFVNTSADGDVVIAFGNSTIELDGVQNQGWASIQDLQNAVLHQYTVVN